MKALCIIPARGGSKRIPRKNIRPFLGEPVIWYAIRTALRTQLFSEVMVSTDDEEIAAVAEKGGASVPFLRSSEKSDDHATTYDVLAEVIKRYQERNLRFDYVCCLYPVTPLTTENHLRSGYQNLLEGSFNSVLPVIPFSYPIWRSFKIEGNRLEWNWPAHAIVRSQDLPEAYHDAGQWYWFRPDNLLEEGVLISQNTGYIKLDETEVQDVDVETDWKLLELKYRIEHG